MGKSTISMVIFNSYVKLPEGRGIPYGNLREFCIRRPLFAGLPGRREEQLLIFNELTGSQMASSTNGDTMDTPQKGGHVMQG